MAYQTGTVASAAELKSTITTFATTYGWTITGGWLSKGLSSVALSNDSPQTGYLGISGACSADGTLNPTAFTRYLYIPPANWPITYYLFSQTNPDIIACTIVYDTDWVQHLIFGDIVKVNDSAYVGGNFFYAPCSNTAHVVNSGYINSQRHFIGAGFGATSEKEGIGLTTIRNKGYIYDSVSGTGQPSCMPLHPHEMSSVIAIEIGLHAEIDGYIWDTTAKTRYTDQTITSLYRSPSQWTSQAILTPINLCYTMTDSLYGYLGYMEHVRLVRVDNYNIADEITISPDVWKVFPIYKKNADQPDGMVPANWSTYSYGHTGTIGIAYRK